MRPGPNRCDSTSYQALPCLAFLTPKGIPSLFNVVELGFKLTRTGLVSMHARLKFQKSTSDNGTRIRRHLNIGRNSITASSQTMARREESNNCQYPMLVREPAALTALCKDMCHAGVNLQSVHRPPGPILPNKAGRQRATTSANSSIIHLHQRCVRLRSRQLQHGLLDVDPIACCVEDGWCVGCGLHAVR